jgi:SAM-dependent methyltransferase
LSAICSVTLQRSTHSIAREGFLPMQRHRIVHTAVDPRRRQGTLHLVPVGALHDVQVVDRLRPIGGHDGLESARPESRVILRSCRRDQAFNGPFDVVYSSGLFTQIPDDGIAAALASEMKRVVRPGGRIIVRDAV